MTRTTRSVRLLLVAFVAVAAALPLAQAALAGTPAPPVPGTIAPPEGHKVFLVGHAVGDQIYSCSTAGGAFAWRLLAPDAVLYADNGQVLATHFGGPTWQAMDGSFVVGSRVDGVTVDANAIPWLLLSAASHAGPDGDRLADTTYIQRIATTGGLAPAAADCHAGTAGETRRVSYTADYVFWKATGA